MKAATLATGIATAVCIAITGSIGAAAQTLRVLHSFCAAPDRCDGDLGFRGLLMDSKRNLFGVTYYGGQFGKGKVFELQRQRNRHYKFVTLHSFNGNDGENPYSSLIFDIHGDLYGVTLQGGVANKGVVFEVMPSTGETGHKWKEEVLYSFCSTKGCSDGYGPSANLSYAGVQSGLLYDGVSPLFGTAESGGSKKWGVAFALTPNGAEWKQTVLHAFCSKGGADCTDGAIPVSSLLPDQAGNLYGVTLAGGIPNQLFEGGAGVAFELVSDGGWSERILYNFCSATNCTDGYAPTGNLTMDSAGNILGVTAAGGLSNSSCANVHGCGTIYKLAPDQGMWVLNTMHTFCQEDDCTDGQLIYEGVSLDPKGNLFGTTLLGGGNDIDQNGKGGGLIYELSGTSFKVLYRFCALPNCADGEYPFTQLLVNKFGRLFGTTEYGGVSTSGQTAGNGDVFELRGIQGIQ